MKVTNLKILFLMLFLASTEFLFAQTPPPPPPPPELSLDGNITIIASFAILFGIYKLQNLINTKKTI